MSKVYVHESKESAKKRILTLQFDLIYEIEPLESNLVAASMAVFGSDSSVLDKWIKDDISDDFEEFVENVHSIIESHNFTVYESHFSNVKNSNSWYVSFVKESELESLEVRCMFFMRISDHKLKSKTNSGFNRADAEKSYRQHITEGAEWMNKNSEKINPIFRSVVVNKEKYTTFMNALSDVIDILNQFCKM